MAPPGRPREERSALGVAAAYLSALLQGVSLITPAAAATIVTSPEFHGLSNSQYGSTFVPMIAVAIVASLGGPRLARRVGIRSVLMLGIAGNAGYLALLSLSSLVVGATGTAYVLLLGAMGTLGLGFGLTMTAVNAYAVAFFPERADAAVTALHASLGVGTVVAPLSLTAFLGGGFWPGHALAMLAFAAALVALAGQLPLRLPVDLGGGVTGAVGPRRFPRRLLVYAAALILYATAEGTFSSWAGILVSAEKGLSLTVAGFALAAFWGMQTVGRVVAALAVSRIRAEVLYVLSPVGITASFLLIPAVSGAAASILAFALAGLACSYFSPLTISFPSKEFPRMLATVSGLMTASIMLGIGMGSLAVGVVSDFVGTPISTIYQSSAPYAILLFLLAYYLAATRLRRGLAKAGV